MKSFRARVDNVCRIREVLPDVPIIVLTGMTQKEVALEAVRRGAQDYLVKGEFKVDQLARSIRFAVERAELWRQLEESRKKEAEMKDQFLSHVSHELRTPLTAMLQFVAILRDGIAGPLNPEQTDCVEVLQRNIHQLKHMIGTLVDVNRVGMGKLVCQMEPSPVGAILNTATASFAVAAKESGIQLDIEYPEDEIEVVADKERINQVLTNLISNALKFTPREGTVTVGADAEANNSGEIRFWVRDTGCGIPEDSVNQVFDRLFQCGPRNEVSRKGMGLGLHISREIVRCHEGRIWAESKLDQGTTFFFILPAYSLSATADRLLGNEGHEVVDIGLITVRTEATTPGARARGVESVLSELDQVIQHCARYPGDESLPSRCINRHQAVSGLAIRADAKGCETIVERLKTSIIEIPMLSELGFTADISITPLLSASDSHTERAKRIHAIAHRLEGALADSPLRVSS